MADNSSVPPIWCDVGKNFNATYLVVSLGHTARRKCANSGDLKKEVKICPQHLEINSHVVSVDTMDKIHGDNVSVHFPGRLCACLQVNILQSYPSVIINN